MRSPRWVAMQSEWLDGCLRPAPFQSSAAASMARQTGGLARQSPGHARRTPPSGAVSCMATRSCFACLVSEGSTPSRLHESPAIVPRCPSPSPPSRVPSYPHRHPTWWPSVCPLVFQAFLSPAQHHPGDMDSSGCPPADGDSMTTIAPIPPTLVTCVDHRETAQAHTHIFAARASRLNPLALLPLASVGALCSPATWRCRRRASSAFPMRIPTSGTEWMTTDARTSASIVVRATLAGRHSSMGVLLVYATYSRHTFMYGQAARSRAA